MKSRCQEFKNQSPDKMSEVLVTPGVSRNQILLMFMTINSILFNFDFINFISK